MEKDESLLRLKQLLQRIENHDHAMVQFQQAKDALRIAEGKFPSKLSQFDNEHKASYIASKIGPEPTKPSKKLKWALPVYIVKNSQYNRSHKEYEKLLPLAEDSYREAYYEKRKELAQQDTIDQASTIKRCKEELAKAEDICTVTKTWLDEDDLLTDKLKTKEIVCSLIGYFNDGRADTLKEAINMWHDEKRKDEEAARAEAHRKKMMELEEERVRAAQAAEEYAQMQYEEAREANEYARQAAADAQDAAERAKEIEFRIDQMEWERDYPDN